MKLSIRDHNIIDYIAAAGLVLSPYIFQFDHIEPARNTFLFLGLGLALYSAFTVYQYSFLKIIPLKTHMHLDLFTGLVLMISPWLFDYRNDITNAQIALHFVLGLALLGLVMLTEPTNLTKLFNEDECYSDVTIKRAS